MRDDRILKINSGKIFSFFLDRTGETVGVFQLVMLEIDDVDRRTNECPSPFHPSTWTREPQSQVQYVLSFIFPSDSFESRRKVNFVEYVETLLYHNL